MSCILIPDYRIVCTRCRRLQPAVGSECLKELRLESSSAAAGLCALFKACARSCCLICLQLLNRLDDQLSSAVCVFLHQHLLAPMPEDFPGSDPDLENCDPDRPSLAEEAFEQLGVVNTLRQSAQGLSGKQCGPFSLKPVIDNAS